MSRPLHPVAVILTLLVLVASACGNESTEASTDTTESGESSTSTVTTEPTTSTTSAPAEEPEDGPEPEGSDEAPEEEEEPAADLVIEGSFLDGEVIIEDRRFEVERGSSVLITFESDQAEHIHLHGYDLLIDLVPGQRAELAFVADSPGSFEVELEDSSRFLFELLVR